MADDLNRLLIKIQADTTQLQSALKQAETGVSSSSARIESTLARNSAKFQSWAGGITSYLGKVGAAYLSYEGVLKTIDAIDTAGKIKDNAAAAGVSIQQFQELAFAAGQAGSSTEDLSKALDKFSVNMSQVRLNTGDFNKFLTDFAPGLRNALQATTSQSQAISVLSNFLAGLGDESERAQVKQAAFGKGAADLNETFDKGAASLKTYADKAHDLGVTLSDELVKKADETDKKFKELKLTLDTMFEKVAIGAADFFTDLSDALNKIKSAAQNGGAKGLFDLFTHSGSSDSGGTPLTLNAGQPSGLLAGLSGIAGKLPAIVPPQHLQKPPNTAAENSIAGLLKQSAEAQGNIQEALQDSYDQELKGFQKMLDNKEISEQQFATARKSLQDSMTAQVKENLGAETQIEKDYYSGIRDSIESTFMDTFTSALEGGKFKASQFFSQLLEGFAKVTTEVLVLKPLLNNLFAGSSGTNGVGSFLNGIIGSVANIFGGSSNGWAAGTTVIPARAAGGPGMAGQSYLTGEHGPELFTPSTNGSFGGSGVYARGGNSAPAVYNIDARGADIGVFQRLQQAIAITNRQAQSSPASVRAAAKRFPNR